MSSTACPVENPHPWQKTVSLLDFVAEKVKTEDGLEILKRLPTRVSHYSEKLDGVNLSKVSQRHLSHIVAVLTPADCFQDSAGNIFSRGSRLPPDLQTFRKTSLEAVREVDVGAFKDRLNFTS